MSRELNLTLRFWSNFKLTYTFNITNSIIGGSVIYEIMHCPNSIDTYGDDEPQKLEFDIHTAALLEIIPNFFDLFDTEEKALLFFQVTELMEEMNVFRIHELKRTNSGRTLHVVAYDMLYDFADIDIADKIMEYFNKLVLPTNDSFLLHRFIDAINSTGIVRIVEEHELSAFDFYFSAYQDKLKWILKKCTVRQMLKSICQVTGSRIRRIGYTVASDSIVVYLVGTQESSRLWFGAHALNFADRVKFAEDVKLSKAQHTTKYRYITRHGTYMTTPGTIANTFATVSNYRTIANNVLFEGRVQYPGNMGEYEKGYYAAPFKCECVEHYYGTIDLDKSELLNGVTWGNDTFLCGWAWLLNNGSDNPNINKLFIAHNLTYKGVLLYNLTMESKGIRVDNGAYIDDVGSIEVEVGE